MSVVAKKTGAVALDLIQRLFRIGTWRRKPCLVPQRLSRVP
jgi:hypothetical protein